MFALALLLFALPAHAADRQQTMMALANGSQVYVDYQKAEPGHSTVVLLNGLTYSTATWDKFVDPLTKLAPGTGILRYDMRGMGKTLLAGPLPVNYFIPLESQVADLRLLLENLHLSKVVVIGLSYGGGVGAAFASQNPGLVEQLILMAPYTEAVASQDQWIRSQVRATRLSFPYNPYTDDELYDYYLRQLIFTTYPAAEPVVLENPFKLEAVFRMVQGIRKFDATKVAALLPAGSVHLMLAQEDQYLDPAALEKFWDSLPNAQRASRINISKTEHKMPEAIPTFVAAWVSEILHHNPKISGGRVFTGSTWNRLAKSGALEINLPEPSVR
jgi:pimeloyl-ACP methyl ester carboxylesterase